MSSSDINQKIIQSALEYAENIVETVREPLVVLNSDLKILTANHSFYDTFKVMPEETIGNFIYDIGNRQWDIPKLRVLLEEILPQKTVFNDYEVEHDFLNIGHKIILLNARQIFRGEIGSHIILLAMEDITERKRAAAALLKSEKKFSKIFNSAPALIGISTLKEHRFIDVNQEFLQTLGYQREEVIGKTSHELCLWEDESDRAKMIRIMEEQGSIRNLETRIKGKTGQTITGLFSAELIDLDEDQHILSIVRDVTERKFAEEEIEKLNVILTARAAELEDANQELEAFNYTVAHDLRNPLSIISSYCEIIQQMCGSKLNKDCKGYLRDMFEGIHRMSRLINTLLKFSSITHSEIRHDKVDLSRLAQEVVTGLKVSAPECRVTFRIGEGIVAVGDAGLLRVVLDNLLSNALKYNGTRDDGIIEFGTTEVDGNPAYFVRDNGTGFDMAKADNLFTPFKRLPGAEDCSGFGIGLATVDRIIRRHGGRIWAESKVGEGAKFYFTL